MGATAVDHILIFSFHYALVKTWSHFHTDLSQPLRTNECGRQEKGGEDWEMEREEERGGKERFTFINKILSGN